MAFGWSRADITKGFPSMTQPSGPALGPSETVAEALWGVKLWSHHWVWGEGPQVGFQVPRQPTPLLSRSSSKVCLRVIFRAFVRGRPERNGVAVFWWD